uniref:NADH-ubiquinone oxidoreductase chain 1 n=1 Tax=Noteridae sp. MJTNT-2012 TaxID=1227477 RepID=S4SUL9_9COLE|nr:NADH dehydrogenase subunit 1 [Noteridae sp. MJTNT-2012]
MYNIEVFLVVFSFLILVVCVLVGVAFLTLLERKVLGYIQIRKGPNKVGYMGILQPFSDAIKLFSKEQTYPLSSNYMMYYYSPIFSLFLSLLIWILMPYSMGVLNFDLGIIFMMCCMSLGVYMVMIAGWSSNSVYSLLGSLRAIAQTISYEVSLMLIFMSYIIFIGSFNFLDFYFLQGFIWLFFLFVPMSLVVLVSMLAETNRTPFDFAEGESELVSGFNVEYSSGGFALIFMSEYSSILFMSTLFSIIFGCWCYKGVFYAKVVFCLLFFIWARGTLPRYRYDKLMGLCWKSYLPVSLSMLIFFSGVKSLFIVLII